MKCPVCKGKTVEQVLIDGLVDVVPCKCCGGKGVVEPLNNEEWFCSLPTEEKAKRIINIAVNSDCDYRTIVDWLKEKHESERK